MVYCVYRLNIRLLSQNIPIMKKEYRCNALSTWFAREAICVSEKEPQNEKRHVCRWNQSCGGGKQLTRYVPLRDDQQECIFRRVSQPVYASRDILEKRQTPLLSFPKDRGRLFKLPARFCRCELESEITIYRDLSGSFDRPYRFSLLSIFSKCLEFTVLSRKERTKKNVHRTARVPRLVGGYGPSCITNLGSILRQRTKSRRFDLRIFQPRHQPTISNSVSFTFGEQQHVLPTMENGDTTKLWWFEYDQNGER